MQLTYKEQNQKSSISVPGSKSIANRMVMLSHLYFPNLQLTNLPNSTDTLFLVDQLNLLKEGSTKNFFANDGGTTLRFLLVALAVNNKEATLTGTKELMSRPHTSLINSLRDVGFSIDVKDTYIYIHPTQNEISQKWSIDVSKSSQYASALLLIAPNLSKPVEIKLTGNMVSHGYLNMTVKLMQQMGIDVQYNGNTIKTTPFHLNQSERKYAVEADWSSISYFVTIAAIAKKEVRISNVSHSILQPDIAILDFGKLVGVESKFNHKDLILTPINDFSNPQQINRDYTNCPDIALTELVCCKALGIEIKQTGIDHLKHKESDRMTAIQSELAKFSESKPSFNTHHDHRIAMSLAPLSIIKPIQFDNIDVVSKSFPDFWEQIEKLGFQLKKPHG